MYFPNPIFVRHKNCTKTDIFIFSDTEEFNGRKADPDPHQGCGSTAGVAEKVTKNVKKLRFLTLLLL
jgi:hypothetical protein